MSSKDGMREQQEHQRVGQVRRTPTQVLRLEPVVAAVYGGGTSAVVMRGSGALPEGGVRVRPEDRRTSADPTVS